MRCTLLVNFSCAAIMSTTFSANSFGLSIPGQRHHLPLRAPAIKFLKAKKPLQELHSLCGAKPLHSE